MNDIQDYVDRLVASAPPLSPEQQSRISGIFASAGNDAPVAKRRNPNSKTSVIERLAEGLDIEGDSDV